MQCWIKTVKFLESIALSAEEWWPVACTWRTCILAPLNLLFGFWVGRPRNAMHCVFIGFVQVCESYAFCVLLVRHSIPISINSNVFLKARFDLMGTAFLIRYYSRLPCPIEKCRPTRDYFPFVAVHLNRIESWLWVFEDILMLFKMEQYVNL